MKCHLMYEESTKGRIDPNCRSETMDVMMSRDGASARTGSFSESAGRDIKNRSLSLEQLPHQEKCLLFVN